MATIEFGPDLKTGFVSRVWEGNTSPDVSYSAAVPLFSTGATWSGMENIECLLNVYKGTVPSSLDELNLVTSRDVDKLVTFDHYSTSEFLTYSDFDNNPVTITTVYKAAANTGTATWFRLFNYKTTGTEPFSQIVGSIGLVGSGADLQMSTTDIVSGKYYRIVNLRISIPLNTLDT